ncbi:ABC transporter permease [Streptomyces sp. TG1A-8]|uniref:DUF7224 domain-containing protein n=1 Tax=Streptomyces sp. TG1A-8 TaxID=3051385 RepID=UPI00265C6A3C|nr:ABC transporter permease [Streptomyces sp. TG1A-8]MDO0930130.1 ABC transporter permease [Streptomyces sp. TG1A-8]
MVKIYLLELRRSPIFAAFPAMVLIDLFVLFGRSHYWIGVWPEASAAAQVTTLFLGPVLAAVSAWQAGRASRSDMPTFLLAAARPPWQAEAARLGATLTMGFGAYAVGCVIAAAVSYPDAGKGFLWPSYLLLGVATLTLYAAVGHLVGRAWSSPAFTPIVCALGGFIIFLAVGQSFGLYVLSGTPDTQLAVQAVGVRLLTAAMFAALAVSAPVRMQTDVGHYLRRRSLAVRSVFTISLIMCFVTPFVVLTTGPLRAKRAVSSESVVCERRAADAPRVCVWREHGKYLPDLARMAQRLDSVPQDWVQTPTAFYEFGIKPTPLGDRGFDVTEGHVRAAAIAMAGQIAYESLGMRKCPPPNESAQAWQAMDSISLWLEYRAMGVDPKKADEGLHMSGVDASQKSAAQAVKGSEQEQKQWTEEQRKVLRDAGCAKTP